LELAQRKLRRMEAVAEGEGCREQALLLAVGELAPPCGRCDSCRSSPRPRDWSEQAGVLLAMLQERGGRDLRSLAGDLAGRHDSDEERWAWLARRLVQEELLSESDDGAQRLWLRSSGRRWLRSPWPLRWAA
jgi:ATP-dependent DNA helicase RecQ